MQPTDGFWEGIGASVGSSPGWMVVGALLVIGALFIIAKHIVPSRERVKMRELDIREHEAENDEERIKANAALAEQMSALRSSNEQIAQNFASTSAGIEESKARSREMGWRIDRIDSTTAHTSETADDTNAKVTEMHAQLRDIYNMQNRRA